MAMSYHVAIEAKLVGDNGGVSDLPLGFRIRDIDNAWHNLARHLATC